MNWFPVLTALAIAAVTFLGVSNPPRAIELILSLSAVFLVWLGWQIWMEFRKPALALRAGGKGRIAA
jgi:threonine/homoserine/homoserine lactone efflux protein